MKKAAARNTTATTIMNTAIRNLRDIKDITITIKVNMAIITSITMPDIIMNMEVVIRSTGMKTNTTVITMSTDIITREASITTRNITTKAKKPKDTIRSIIRTNSTRTITFMTTITREVSITSTDIIMDTTANMAVITRKVVIITPAITSTIMARVVITISTIMMKITKATRDILDMRNTIIIMTTTARRVDTRATSIGDSITESTELVNCKIIVVLLLLHYKQLHFYKKFIH